MIRVHELHDERIHRISLSESMRGEATHMSAQIREGQHLGVTVYDDNNEVRFAVFDNRVRFVAGFRYSIAGPEMLTEDEYFEVG